ncbi:MAG: hypothetical protein HYU66_03515 [Armatimonadetes bacterium]|nr:hypothetical protein [Armatimonadota bacterium]
MTYHKQAYSWGIAGFIRPAQRLLTWARDQRLQPDGQLAEYAGDCYKHAWFFHGAHRLARFELSYPVFDFLASCQAPCGGLPHFAGQPLLRSMATCWTGVAAIYRGRLEVAEKAAGWALSVLEQQPDPRRFYYQTDRTGRLALDGEFVDAGGSKQAYWEVALPLQLCCRLSQATGERRWLEAGAPFFEFLHGCEVDPFTWAGGGKGCLAAALWHHCTGDPRGRERACEFGEFLCATQYPEGGWRDETEPDLPLIYIDHAAEFNIWLHEVVGIL